MNLSHYFPDIRTDVLAPPRVIGSAAHPLAGLALNLALTVREVRAATAEEIQAGSVGTPAISVLQAHPPGPHLH